MGAAIRKQKLPLKDEVFEYGGKFSFETAAQVLEFGTRVSFGKEINVRDAPFKTSSIYSFYLRGAEISKIAKKNGENVVHIERLAIAGLNAPLPSPYGELVFRRTLDQDDAMHEFFNIFNTRLLGISYQVSRRIHLGLQNHLENYCNLISVAANLFGGIRENIDKRISRLAYIFWTKERSAEGLRAIISHRTGLDVRIEEFLHGWEKLDETNRLGRVKLGEDSYLGRYISTADKRVKIYLGYDNADRIFKLIDDENRLKDLRNLIRRYLGIFVRGELEFSAKQTSAALLGKCFLGKNSLLPGKNLDAITIPI